ncbi:MAG: right-handed parallel beta-helix repeat-containing protein [Ignavibacteriales bacterium]|nr:right-handed parallel beta-helix repeat-containing protein [Ignavibacteriales bacterium]MCB9258487.1 right-handed parallel beta-helix repeat-containing protein [Ignavibacteriales bacterium]
MKNNPNILFKWICISIFFISSIDLTYSTNHKQERVSICDFGLIANSKENATLWLIEALDSLRKLKNPTLVFPKGRYDFYPEGTLKINYFESNTTDTNPKTCPILIKNIINLIIDGSGSEFVFHGKMQPFTIDSSKNITIKNLSIDWDIPFGTEAQVVGISTNYFDLQIDTIQHPYKIENEKLFFLCEGSVNLWGYVKWNDPMEFDKNTLQVVPGTGDKVCIGDNWENYKASEISNGVVRITGNFSRHPAIGNIMVLRHGVRDHAGMFILNSKNVSIQNINMYSNCGISFLAQYSENLTFKNVNCVPNPKKRKVMSGHDDGIHISNCKGDIIADSCSFIGLMDDSFNIHGTSVKIVNKINERKLLCKFMHEQSIGLDWARHGDIIGFIDHSTMETITKGIVKSFEALTSELFEITIEEPFPKNIELNDALENLTWMPNVTIKNSYFGNHRARGILVSTSGKVIIENNIFESSGSAIVIPGDANHWFESGSVKDVTIVDNIFKETCLTSQYQFCEAIISIYPEIPEVNAVSLPFHSNISISNNTFELFDFPILYAKSVQNLNFENNVLKRSYAYKPYHDRKYTLSFEACKNVRINGNMLDKNLLGKNILAEKIDKKDILIQKTQGFNEVIFE